MCTVLLRLSPGSRWPLLLAAVRDEFLGRPWDPPAAHWPQRGAVLGGRDRQAGGTWLAVEPAGPAVAALLNGPRLAEREDRPSRGGLVLDVLTGRGVPDDVTAYDAFHLLYGTVLGAELWSWDGSTFTHAQLTPGDHVLVNQGPDADSPVVATGRAVLGALPSPDWPEPPLTDPLATWGPWLRPLEAEPSEQEGRLVVRHDVEGRTYGSSSVSLVGLSPSGSRYDFSAVPAAPGSWQRVLPI